MDGKEETPDKHSEDAKIKKLKVGKAPRQQRDQTPLKTGSSSRPAWDTAGMPPWWYQRKDSWKTAMRSGTSSLSGVWNVREDSKESRNKNPKAFVRKREGKSLVSLLGEKVERRSQWPDHGNLWSWSKWMHNESSGWELETLQRGIQPKIIVRRLPPMLSSLSTRTCCILERGSSSSRY